MEIGEVKLEWLGQSGFLIKNSRVIYIDPFNIKDDMEKADIILITHGHQDHCSIVDLNKIVKEGTRVFCTADAQSKIMRFDVPIKIEIVEPGQEYEVGDTRIYTVPAYNVDKSFHPKEEGWVGYLVKVNGVVIYHAGDTDVIPEMQKLTGHKQPDKTFIALLPIGGRFTMSAEEAAEAASIIKPNLAIPMHYGSVVGSESDAEEFKEICEENGIEVKILKKI
ncbi:MAG: MBL fold metallo-hydrolase [Nanoarchaeota archaeon]|nr:MBL fold metallo-hydrolase [Nanoarchaeota archaeon]